MKTYPILYKPEMIKAIFDQSKKQTRRTNGLKDINENPDVWNFCSLMGFSKEDPYAYFQNEFTGEIKKVKFPFGYIGDIMWARETWQHTECLGVSWDDDNYGYVYKADGQPWDDDEHWTWKPSIFMPKSACRLFKKVVSVGMERLKNISEEDAKCEGVKSAACESVGNCVGCNDKCQGEGTFFDYLNPSGECGDPCDSARESFFTLWESINGRESLDLNPYVWVYTFEITDRPKDF